MTTTTSTSVTNRRRDRMLAMYRAGSVVYDIACHHGMRVAEVRDFLEANGEEVPIEDRHGDRADAMWSLPDDERRQAFAKRASRGARETLKQSARGE